MNSEQWEGKWKELKGILKQKWGALTDNDLTELEGHRDRLAGLVEQRYGLAKEEAERQIREFEKMHIGGRV